MLGRNKVSVLILLCLYANFILISENQNMEVNWFGNPPIKDFENLYFPRLIKQNFISYLGN
jgi:hypothetical protein